MRRLRERGGACAGVRVCRRGEWRGHGGKGSVKSLLHLRVCSDLHFPSVNEYIFSIYNLSFEHGCFMTNQQKHGCKGVNVHRGRQRVPASRCGQHGFRPRLLQHADGFWKWCGCGLADSV